MKRIEIKIVNITKKMDICLYVLTLKYDSYNLLNLNSLAKPILIQALTKKIELILRK